MAQGLIKGIPLLGLDVVHMANGHFVDNILEKNDQWITL